MIALKVNLFYSFMNSTLERLSQPFRHAQRHRAVLRGFVSKEVSGRYAGSYVGLLWIVLEPLATIVVYSLVFTYVFRVSLNPVVDGTASFTVYFLAGYFPWLMLSDALSRAAGSVIGNSSLVTKVIFPVELLPLSSVLSSFLTHGVGLALYLLYLGAIGKAGASWLLLPVFLGFHALFCCGLALFVSALVVFVRDIQQSLGIVLMVWFYITPILYPVAFVPGSLQKWMALNPMMLLVVPFRDTLLLGRFDWDLPLKFAALSILVYSMGAWFFMRSKRAFADVL